MKDLRTVPAIQVALQRARETKNTWRYEARDVTEGEIPPVDTLYIQKSALREWGGAPERIVVTVEPEVEP